MKKIVDKEDVLVYIYQHIEVPVKDILNIFNISESTAHRVLKQLSQENWIIIEQHIIYYKPFTLFPYKDKEKAILINALAWNATKIINEGDVICLSGGSTSIAVILPFIILTKKNITIISNSSLVFQYYLLLHLKASEQNITLLTIGGILRQHFYSFGGEYADEIIDHFNISKTFLGAESINVNQGLFTDTLGESFVETAFMNVSKATYLVATSDKFSSKGKYKWADWGQFKGIISDYNLDIFKKNKVFEIYQVDTKNIWQ